jgi:DNA invertase Pin-like site-specific DNA recombinase
MSATATRLAQAGHRWDRAKREERTRMAMLYAEMIRAYKDGMPETEIARTAGVDRMTVRRALGKR